MPTRSRNIVLAAFALVLALLPLLAKVSPLQDQMDWVLQAKILADPSNPDFAPHYQIQWRPVPNLLGTAAIAIAAQALPIFRAASVVYALYLIWFVFAFTYLVRADGKQRPLIELLGVLYAANHFFLMGFYNFVLGLAFAFFGLGYLLRHAKNATAKNWLWFSLISLAVYLSHFLPFFILCLGGGLVLIDAYRRQWRRYLAPILALLPSLAGLLWYTQHRASEFWFHYAFHNPLYYTWYKLGPLAVATNYYPLTPAWAAWVNIAINTAAIGAILILATWAVWRKQVDPRSPLFWAAAALVVIGLLTPTRIYELLRPGQRLIFAAMLLLAATTRPRAELTSSKYRLATIVLAMLLCWNGIWWFDATQKTLTDLKVIQQKVGGNSKMLLLADSHFHYREARSYREKLTDPFSYPNSVNPLRYVPYAHIIEHGGYMRALFGTGIVQVRDPELLPAISRPWDLADPEKAGRYTHLIATGQPDNLLDLGDKAAPLFDKTYLGNRILVMHRKAGE